MPEGFHRCQAFPLWETVSLAWMFGSSWTASRARAGDGEARAPIAQMTMVVRRFREFHKARRQSTKHRPTSRFVIIPNCNSSRLKLLSLRLIHYFSKELYAELESKLVHSSVPVRPVRRKSSRDHIGDRGLSGGPSRRGYRAGWTGPIKKAERLECVVAVVEYVCLFIAQRLHGIQPSRLARRPNAEKQSDPYAHHDPQSGGPQRHRGRQIWKRKVAGERNRIPDQHPRDPAQPGQHYSLRQELKDDVFSPRADGFAHADLARPLGDRHEHNINHTDPAHKQANGAEHHHHDGHHGGDGAEILHHLVRGRDHEVIRSR